MQPVSRIRARLLPTVILALGVSACASTAQQPPTVSADAVMRVADMTRNEGDLASAVGLYQKAHELNPTDPQPLMQLGQTLAKLGSPAAAAEAYRAALQLDGTNAEALRGLGTAYLNTGQPEAAVAQYEKALDTGEDYRLYNGIAVAYDMLGDHASAQTYYKTALQLSPGNLEVNNNLGLSLALEGRYQEAIALLQRTSNDPMATARYRQNLALVYGLAGDREQAQELAERDLDPATVQRNMTYFNVLKGMGDDRTIASALGAHYADQVPTATPVAALPEANGVPVVAAPDPESIATDHSAGSDAASSALAPTSMAAPAAPLGSAVSTPAVMPAVTEPRDGGSPVAAMGEIEQPVAAPEAQPATPPNSSVRMSSDFR